MSAVGKVAVVTGANKGIGLEIARKMGQAGAKVVLACRTEVLGQQAAAELVKEGYDAIFLPLDISDEASHRRFVETCQTSFGKIDILINNAGIAFKAADPTTFQDQAAPTVNTNFFGTLNFTRAMLPSLLQLSESAVPRVVNVASQAGHLRIIKDVNLKGAFISSDLTLESLEMLMHKFIEDVEGGIHAEHGWPSSCYGMSKLGVTAATKILAAMYPNILFASCCPGYCDTDMTSHKGTKTAEAGARTPFWLAVGDDLKMGEVSGKFFAEEKEIEF